MYSVIWIIGIPLFLFSLMRAFPYHTRAIKAEILRQIRLYAIQKYGKEETPRFHQKWRAFAAKQGYSEEETEEILEVMREEIIKHLGTQAANARLGEPTIYERYY